MVLIIESNTSDWPTLYFYNNLHNGPFPENAFEHSSILLLHSSIFLKISLKIISINFSVIISNNLKTISIFIDLAKISSKKYLQKYSNESTL